MNFNKPSSSSKKFPPMDTGVFPARIVQLIDLGIQESEWQGETKRNPKVQITFEFPTETIEVDGEHKPRWLGKEYTVSMHEKSALAALVSSADPSGKATANGSKPEGLLGLPLSVSVGRTSTGNAKVSGVAGMMKGMQVDELKNPPTFFDLSVKGTWDAFEKLPDWLKEKIKTGINFSDTPFARKDVTYKREDIKEDTSLDDSPY